MKSQLTRRQALGLLGALALPLDWSLAGEGAPTLPTADPRAGSTPDLGNFHEMMTWLSREKTRQLSFLEPRFKSLVAWKKVARPAFRRGLNYSPAPRAGEHRTLKVEQRDGFSIETVSIAATNGYDIPAKVLVPSQRKGR